MNMEWQSWLESMFLDPLTSFLDESIFRIDVFETESVFIIEAFIEEDRYQHAKVTPQGDMLIISAVAKSDGATYSRKLTLPHITAPLRIVHQHSILEVFIDK